jgi:DNA polymerase-1
MKQNNDKSPLILIDGSSYLYRAFHALPSLTNSKGQPTGAIYGVLNMINRLIKDYHPSHIVVIFDAKGKTFRHKLYPEYKAHRPPMPDELVSQIKYLHEIIVAMGLPLLAIEGVDADDVIGTLAKQATEHQIDTIISTCDKDLAQLVNDHVTLINTMSKTTLDITGVKNKFGITPQQIVDYLTLIGDTSDNIPGVAKVGPKTAVKWLKQYHSLDEITKHANEIPGKVGENLQQSIKDLPLFKRLITIDCEVKLPINSQNLIPQTKNKTKLLGLFKELEFKGLLAEALAEKNNANIAEVSKKYSTILTEKDFNNLLKLLQQADLIAIDTETTDLNYMNAEIVGLSFAINANEAYYLPLAHDYAGVPQQLNRKQMLAQLKPILEDPNKQKVGHNLKYDQKVLANYKINLQGIVYDTMLESYVLDNTTSRHNLDSLALKYLGHKNISYEEIAGKGAKQIPFSQVPIEQATDYAAEDADITLQLHQYLWPKIENNPKIKHVFNDVDMPLINILSRMERYGVLVDAKALQQQSNEISERLLSLKQQVFSLADCVFNLDSPKQLQEIFYTKLGLPILKRTPKGQPSTAEPILQELALNFPLPKLILEYRSLSKLKSTYTDKLPLQINPQTNRIHTSYQQTVTSTGRLASSNPNLQNIPIRTNEGKRIRKAFIAPPDYKILAADYSQIELRLMAHLSQDKNLLDAFKKGLDIHSATAAQVFGKELDQVTTEQRRKAKAINFGLIYGISAFGLTKQLGIERAAAQTYIDAYFAQYPKVLAYMQKTCELAHQHGYVETLFGRRLYINDINVSNKHRQKAAERAAINAPLQGTAADIIKLAMIAIDQWIQNPKIDAHMIMQVHDELVFEVHEKDLDLAQKDITKLMNDVVKLAIPLIVDIGIGNNWDEAH